MKLFSIPFVSLALLTCFLFYQFQLTNSLKNELLNTLGYKERIELENKNLGSETIKLKEQNFQLDAKLKETMMKLDKINETRKIAYLTFDDGPSENTRKILKTLKKYDIKATFFVNGNISEASSNIYKEIVKEGHSIGNHTFSHQYSEIYSNKKSFFKDFNDLEHLLKNNVGFKPTLVRFPGGSNNQVSIQYGGANVMTDIIHSLNEKGYVYVDWNVDSMDASAKLVGKEAIMNAVINQSKGKQHINILMHDSAQKTTTAEALPGIIDGLLERGFYFEKLTPDSPKFQFPK